MAVGAEVIVTSWRERDHWELLRATWRRWFGAGIYMDKCRNFLGLGRSEWVIDSNDGFFKPQANNMFSPWT